MLLDDFFIDSTPAPQLPKTTTEIKPEKPILVQSYPNPFSVKLNQNGILISYQIPAELGVSQVNLSIFNTLGQLIRELVDQTLSPGRYEVFWDVQDETRQHLPAGVYFYRLQIGERVQTRRLVVLD